MITFLILSYMNPKGLAIVIGQLHNHFKDCQVIACFNKADKMLPINIEVCTSEQYVSNTGYLVFETLHLPAMIAYALPLVKSPLICVLNDSIILHFENSDTLALIRQRVEPYLDEIVALYLCLKTVGDNDYKFPIVTRRFIELIGYLYMPLFTIPRICELWLGHIFDMLNRTIPIEGVSIKDNIEFPSQISYNAATSQEHHLLFKNTTHVRKETAKFLLQYMIKE